MFYNIKKSVKKLLYIKNFIYLCTTFNSNTNLKTNYYVDFYYRCRTGKNPKKQCSN